MNETPKAAESEPTSNETTQAAPAARTSLGAGVAALLILATVFTSLALGSVWFNRQILQTSQWESTSSQLLESKNVRDALSNYIVTELFTAADVEGELQNQLPSNLQFFSGAATNGLRELAIRATDKGLASPQFQSAWQNSNKLSHAAFIKILDGNGKYATIDQGTVTINVKSLITDTAKQVGVGQKLISKIPDSAGTIEVLQSSDLKTAQNMKKFSDVSVWLFPLIALLLYAAAIGLAVGRRRKAVLWAGVSWVVIGLFELISISFGKTPFVAALASTSALEPAVTDIYTIITELLRDMANSILFSGVMVILAAVIAGPSRWATNLRRLDAPYLRDFPAATAAVGLFLYLLLIWWAPVSGLRTTLGLLVNTLLVVSGFFAYRHICGKEFPDEPAPEIGAWFEEKWAAARKSVEGRRGGAFPVARKGVGESETLDQIERLADLNKRGILTDEEFARQKQEVLARSQGKG
ncbi:MAG: SHOCT domain-containing protein [Thermoleophilaceae bacterium]|nr:SHOCT domain-containing protein [Thermoleophilaceae bacterium]